MHSTDKIQQAIQRLINYDYNNLEGLAKTNQDKRSDVMGVKTLVGTLVFAVLFNLYGIMTTGHLATTGSNILFAIIIIPIFAFVFWQVSEKQKARRQARQYRAEHNRRIRELDNLVDSCPKLNVKKWWHQVDLLNIGSNMYSEYTLRYSALPLLASNSDGYLYINKLENTTPITGAEVHKLLSNPRYRKLPSNSVYYCNGNYAYATLYLHDIETTVEKVSGRALTESELRRAMSDFGSTQDQRERLKNVVFHGEYNTDQESFLYGEMGRNEFVANSMLRNERAIEEHERLKGSTVGDRIEISYQHCFIPVGKIIFSENGISDILLESGEVPFIMFEATSYNLGENCYATWQSKSNLTVGPDAYTMSTILKSGNYYLPGMDYIQPRIGFSIREWVAWIMAHAQEED